METKARDTKRSRQIEETEEPMSTGWAAHWDAQALGEVRSSKQPKHPQELEADVTDS